MDMKKIQELPTPEDLKKEFPLPYKVQKIKKQRDQEIEDIFTGKDDRLILIIGPCSADREDAVLDYMNRLAVLQEKVKDKIFMIPRVYTNKPRTKGVGYKGMLHQPDPHSKEDMLKGIIAIRKLHTDVVTQTGFTCAEEMLYPENHAYLSDLLGYVAIGARSVENQQHRIVASGVGIPAGMKNPTGGDLTVMMNSIVAAQADQRFVYRGWEVQTDGNPLAHAILRGYVKSDLKNPACIVDCNHSNSNKQYLEQIRIAKDVMHSRSKSEDIKKLVKGLMIESYLEDGNQPTDGNVYGKSITDPCLGWDKTEQLILDLYDLCD